MINNMQDIAMYDFQSYLDEWSLQLFLVFHESLTLEQGLLWSVQNPDNAFAWNVEDFDWEPPEDAQLT